MNTIPSRTARFLPVIFLLFITPRIHAQELALKKEYAKSLIEWSDALLKRQMTTPGDPNRGGIWCAHCRVWHTRAAESVFPFSVCWSITKDARYLKGAKDLAAWLIRQQQPDGSWKETPEEWTGTTTDQLLMLLMSYEMISPQLNKKEQSDWQQSMKKAADYLARVMRPEFASINYVATTTATLAKAGLVFKADSYLQKARELARRTISKMDEDGFLNGEGGKSHGNKMGVDLGYDMEMSLWGLGLYARLTGDTLVNSAVRKALINHLYFIYPDGSMDGSWGIRSNKWTGYGGATSDGCQVLFSLFADDDPRYAAAGWRNLRFLRTNTVQDLIGYGPQHAELFDGPPCIYPTFAKAKNLAMAYVFETHEKRPMPSLPVDETGWMKLFPTLNVVEVRTANFMATITGYHYKDQFAGWKGKYMYRPDGGAMSHVWLKDHGFLQASSPTVYTRPEPMSFPEAPGVVSLTPRIEYSDTAGYFTNLYEFDSRLDTSRNSKGEFEITARGELKDKYWLTGGVSYRMDYLIADRFYQKTIRLTYHDAWPLVKIIEPFIDFKGMKFSPVDDQSMEIQAGRRKLLFRILTPGVRLIAGRDKEKYWTPYPALRAFPLEMELKPEPGHFIQTVTYRLSVEE
ncbi:MAG TPA: hypothetical protein VGM24_01110 [Puia sp.]